MNIRTRHPLFILFLIPTFLTILFSQAAAAPTVEQACATSTWANCGGFVKQTLEAMPNPLPADKVERVVEIMKLWAGAYEKQVKALEAAGRLTRAENDWTKVQEAVTDEINPATIAKDAAIDALLKRYLPRVAAFLEYAKAPAAGLSTFFNSSSTATDFEELSLMNRDLQKRFFNLMEPYFQDNWRKRLEDISLEVGPEIRRN